MRWSRKLPPTNPAPFGTWGLALTCALVLVVTSGVAAVPPGPHDMPRSAASVLQQHPIPATPSDFIHHDVGWALFVYPRDARTRVEPLVECANESRRCLRDELGGSVLNRIEVRVVQDTEQLASLAPRGLPPPADAVGVAYARYRLILLSLIASDGSELSDLEAVYRHELAHVALFDAVDGNDLPLWFNDGYAVHTSGEQSWNRSRTLWDGALSKRLLPVSRLDGPLAEGGDDTPLARAQSADFVRFLLRPQDRDRFRQLVDRLAQGGAFYPALELSYGASLRSLEREWREDLDDRYGYVPALVAAASLLLVAVGAIAVWRRRSVQQRLEHQRRGSDEASEKRRRRAGKMPVVRVTLTPRSIAERVDLAALRRDKLRDVPKVEHDGRWHTLH